MDQDKYIALLYKQLQGDLNLIEKTLLDKWLDEAAINRVLAQKIKEDWVLSEQYSPDIEIDIDKEFSLLQQRIDKEENINTVKVKFVPVKKRARWWPYAAAAALVLLTATRWMIRLNQATEPTLLVTTTSNEIQEVQLSDGTKVLLNKNSELHYPEAFATTDRRVQLEGEAFFDVQKNADKPFIINANHAEIKVLGTSFNVRALASEEIIEVVVKTGKVLLSDTREHVEMIVNANEKARLRFPYGHIKKQPEKDMNELAWNTKVLLFKDTPVPEVVESLERLFNVSIQTSDSSKHCSFSGRFVRPNLEEIITAISTEFDIKVQRDNTSYQLEGGCLVE